MPDTIPYPTSYTDTILRAIWKIVWFLFFLPSPRIFHAWRSLLLKCFGAKLGHHVHVYPSVKIWAPWNLEIRDYGCLGDSVDCYNVNKVIIGTYSTVSQYSYLCGASREYNSIDMPLIALPIIIGDRVWIGADVFIGCGITIGDGAVIGARSSVFSNMPSLMVCLGIPAKPVKQRNVLL